MKNKLTEQQINDRVFKYKNYINRMSDGRTLAIRTTTEFNEVFKLAETSGYKGHMYNALSLQELVEEMSTENYSRPNSNREHMRDVSSRMKMMFGSNIRFDCEYNFIEDLIRAGYIRLYGRPSTLKKVYRSRLAWNSNGEYISQNDLKQDISSRIQRKLLSQGNSHDAVNKVQKRHKNDKFDILCNLVLIVGTGYMATRFAIGIFFSI